MVEAWARRQPPCRVVMEAGTHSRWVSEIITQHRHEVYVADPRSLAMIYKAKDKSDANDAERLARIGRADPWLLSPIQHRGVQAQTDLSLIRARDVLVRARTLVVNAARGLAKSLGERLPKCSAQSFHKQTSRVPPELAEAIGPLMMQAGQLTARIRAYDKQVIKLADEKYPGTKFLQKIAGVGPVTSLAFVLTLEDPHRYKNGRTVGAYLGLVPRKDQSGSSDKQLHITKSGNGYMRRVLVTSAQYILRRSSAPCDLQRWGMAIANRGGKNAKKRAVVAVARKLASTMFHLWRDQVDYDPDYRKKLEEAALRGVETFMGKPRVEQPAA
jgi:transposase